MNSTHQKLFEDKMETDIKGLEAKQTRLFVRASMTNFKPLDVFFVESTPKALQGAAGTVLCYCSLSSFVRAVG